MANTLKSLSDDQVAELYLSLKQDGSPDSIHALCFMRQMMEWKKKDSSLRFKIYSPGGQPHDLTFVLLYSILNGYYLTYYSRSDEGSRQLKAGLESWDLVDSESYCILTSIPDRVHRIVGLAWRVHCPKPPNHMLCHNYLLEPTHQPVQRLPDNVVIRDLQPDDATFINSQWPHKNHITLKVIQDTITSSTSLGLCSKESGELLSWAVNFYYGGIGVVQTAEHAKRKGYAKAVVKELVRRMSTDSWPIHLVIIDDNAPSIALFTSMGFKPLNKCHWFHYNAFN